MSILLSIHSVHITGSNDYSGNDVRLKFPGLGKYYLLLSKYKEIIEKAKEKPSVLYILVSPEGMIASPAYAATNYCTKKEYALMCSGFIALSKNQDNILIIPGTILYRGGGGFHNPAPIFYQGKQYTHIQEIAPPSSNDLINLQTRTYRRNLFKEIYTQQNSLRSIPLNFNGQAFTLIPQICIEHAGNTASKIEDLKPETSLQILISNSIQTFEQAVQANCFIHADIEFEHCHIIKKEPSIFKIVQRQQHSIEYSRLRYCTEISSLSLLFQFFGYRPADEAPTPIPKKLKGE